MRFKPGTLIVAASMWHGGQAFARQQADPNAQSNKPAKSRTIIVTGHRATVKRTIEGTTYDERNNAEGQAGSAEDVLRTVPSVSVSPDGKIAVRGNDDVKVYIDGRPSSADPITLQAIPGSSIASVDLITSPSAKYDADGSIIVNLNLKKGARDGLHGTRIANFGSRDQANVAVDNSFGSRNFVATLNLGVRDDVPIMRNTSATTLFDKAGDPADTFTTISAYTNNHRKSADVSASLGYDLNNVSDVGVDASYAHGIPEDVVHEQHDDHDDARGTSSIYQRIRGGRYYENEHDISAYYEKRGGNKHISVKLTIEDTGKTVVSDRIFTTTYAKSDAPGAVEHVLNKSLSSTRLGSLDIGKSIGGGITLSGGGEWKREANHHLNDRRSTDPGEPPPPSDSAYPIDFDANQRTAAAYATAQAQSGSWTVDVGGRYENIRIGSLLKSEAERRERGYSAVNESISVARKLGDGQILVKAARAKQAIDPNDLDPATLYIDAQTSVAGNPALSPQTVASVEAEYDYTHRSIDGALSLYYRHIDDTIDDFIQFDPDNVSIRTKRNGGPSQSFGVTLSLSDKIFKSLTYSTTVNVFHAELSTLGQAFRPTESMISYTMQGSLDWKMSRSGQLHLDADIDGPTLVPQGTRSGSSALNAVYSRTLSPRLTVTLTARGVLQQMHIRTTVLSGQAISVSDDFTSRRALLIGFKYMAF